jgi:hypothetical protein
MIKYLIAVLLIFGLNSANAKFPGGSGATYYFSPTGSDSNTGISQSTPWQTLTKFNATTFNCGDTVLFQGGQTFSGKIQLYSTGSGGKWAAPCSPLTPFTVDSYGGGRANIVMPAGTPNNTAIDIQDTAGFVIQNLAVTCGSIAASSGIQLFATSTTNITTWFDFVYINNVDISKCDFAIQGGGNSHGFKNVSVINSSLHDNLSAGISFYPSLGTTPQSTMYADTLNFFADKIVAYNNTGGVNGASGSGIAIGGITGGVVQRSHTYNNGIGATGAPVGLWAYFSNHLTMQYNESNNNCGTTDGDGIDIDGANLNHMVQYNYSHDNCGSGVLAWQYVVNAQPWNWNVIRYNITQNNATLNDYGELAIGNTASAQMGLLAVYGNTFRAGTSGKPAIRIFDVPTGSGIIANNIFSVSSGAFGLINTTANANYAFQGNDWSGSRTNLTWNNTSYATVALWIAAFPTQETYRGANTALTSDPLLANLGAGGTCLTSSPPTSGPQPCPSAYLLNAGSPMLNAGQNLSNVYGIVSGSSDYYGKVVPAPSNGNYDVGANQRTQ